MTDVSSPGLRRLLVTGASGFLGWHLCHKASHSWQVHGTHYTHPFQMPGVTAHRLDLTNSKEVESWLSQLQPDGVIHTAALSKPNQCEQEPDLSYQVNVEATRTLARFCSSRQIPLVFTSTEQVFDGESAPYPETAHPSPINVYGRHKYEAEQILQQLHPQAVICRMPLMYGLPGPTSQSFVQGFIQKLEAQQPLPLFVDEYRSPAYVEDAAEGLLMALEKGVGMLHLGGPERISRYQFGLLLAEIFDLDGTSISPSYRAEVPMPAARPADLTTHNHRAIAMGYAPRTPREGLMAMKQTMKDFSAASV